MSKKKSLLTKLLNIRGYLLPEDYMLSSSNLEKLISNLNQTKK